MDGGMPTGSTGTTKKNGLGKRALGVTWISLAALAAGTLSPVGMQAETPVVSLLESEWEDASTVVIDSGLLEGFEVAPEVLEAEVVEILDEATEELTDATDSLEEVLAIPNPINSWETSYVANDWSDADWYFETPQAPAHPDILLDVTSAENRALIDALDNAQVAIDEAEAIINAPGEPNEWAIERANQDLNEALTATENVIEAATANATNAQLVELLEADDALNGAVAAITTVTDERQSWITELNGWAPNLRYAIDRRGPRRRLSGQGIDIAIIDSGITPVQGLDGEGKIINGPDLSTDGANPNLAHLDLYGHGTHLAGILAGNDGTNADGSSPHFTGIAPDARLVNLKVADAKGVTTIPQIVAAIEWAILNKDANGMNIRVLTLAFGYEGPEYLSDPISAAVEEAWANGIVVVVAGGNRGNDNYGLDNPAVDPFVMATAGTDHGSPTDFGDDRIAQWSSNGNGRRDPDIAAPGRSIVSLRVPGSYADSHYPNSRIGERFAVASGTSQASAVLAGSIALLLEHDQTLTPDEIKALLTDNARNVAPGRDKDGSGRLSLNRAIWSLRVHGYPWFAGQYFERAPVPAGFGTEKGGWAGNGWSGSGWSGAGWSGAGWSGSGWSGAGWSGSGWSGAGWSGNGWSGSGWSGAGWSGSGWSGTGWS